MSKSELISVAIKLGSGSNWQIKQIKPASAPDDKSRIIFLASDGLPIYFRRAAFRCLSDLRKAGYHESERIEVDPLPFRVKPAMIASQEARTSL